jgi:cell division transport system permease protein
VKQELMVKVFFVHNAPAANVNALVRQLNQNPLVKSGGVKYTSQDAGFAQMKKSYPAIADEVPSNPLGPRLDVTPDKAEDVDKLYKSIVANGKPAGVDQVTDGKQISHRILKVAHAIEIVFTVATLILIIASILLISNTIRLSIFSRRREIEVMKLVGATNWFVRGPFMLEGLMTGFVGALLAIFFLVLGKAVALPSILPHLSSDPSVHAWPFGEVAVILLGMGLGLGAVGSGVTIRRFLQV